MSDEWKDLGFQEEGDFSDLGFVPSSKERLKNRVGRAAKQFVAGARPGANIAEVLHLHRKGELPGQAAKLKREASVPLERLFLEAEGAEEGLPYRNPISTSEALDLFGIAPPESVAERYIDRASQAAGGAAALGGGPLAVLLGGISGAAGQAAEDVTGSPLAGLVTELGTTALAPKGGKGRVALKKSQRSVGETGRRVGLSESELAPLLKSERKIKGLSKFSTRSGALQKKAQNIKEKLGEGYETLKGELREAPALTKSSEQKIFKALDKLEDSLSENISPSESQKKAIKAIQEIRVGLGSEGANGAQLVGQYQTLNEIIPFEAKKTALKRLSELKDVFVEGIKDVSPKAAKQFQNLNELYGKAATLEKALKKTDAYKYFVGGKLGSFLLGAATGNLGLMKGALALHGSQKIADSLLTNPRLMNSAQRIVETSTGPHRLPGLISSFIREINRVIEKPSEETEQEP